MWLTYFHCSWFISHDANIGLVGYRAIQSLLPFMLSKQGSITWSHNMTLQHGCELKFILQITVWAILNEFRIPLTPPLPTHTNLLFSFLLHILCPTSTIFVTSVWAHSNLLKYLHTTHAFSWPHVWSMQFEVQQYIECIFIGTELWIGKKHYIVNAQLQCTI